MGAVLSFSLTLSWQRGHCAAFNTPTTRPLSSATSTRLNLRPSLAARAAARIMRAPLERSPLTTAKVFGLSAKANPMTSHAASMSTGDSRRISTTPHCGPTRRFTEVT